MDSQDKITVVLTNKNTTLSMNRFEVYDNVSDAPVGVFALKGGESRSIEITRGADGKGSVKIRDLDRGRDEWVESGAIGAAAVITA
ncbi:MAG TPA: hypothetical protein VFU31_23615 [Candidatus Binatia bacterium]|nr:hypothetical protein [Candidatus Binatia bacterium]